MSSHARFRAFCLLSILCVSSSAQIPHKVTTTFDEKKNITAAKLGPVRLASDNDRYHSIDFTLSYEYAGNAKHAPERIEFELVAVVKARRLNSDLYVVFVIDGREVHFGSNRSAIRNPVPGRWWMGERLTFQIPYGEFVKMVEAQKLAIRIGNSTFDFSDDAKAALKASLN